MRIISKKVAGFSLGEVLLAAFVLVSGVMAAMALISRSLQYAYSSRDAVIAVELSQEGVELLRNVRDNDIAAGNNGFTGWTTENKHCRINFDSTAMTCHGSQGSPGAQGYNIAMAGGRYSHTAAPSRFKRYIYLDYDPGNEIARVVSFVFWAWENNNAMPSYVSANGNTSNCNLLNKCVFTEAFFTDWRP